MQTHHKCSFLVATCIDFRIQGFLDEWIKNNLGARNHDRVAMAGGVKNFEALMGQIRISTRLHDIEKVVLINHEDCGAYGELSSEETQREDLNEAMHKIALEFPDLEISLYYVTLEGEFRKV